MSTTSAESASLRLLSVRPASIRSGLTTWISAKVTAYRSWREQRISVATMRGLDDRVLKDIGLDRSEIMSLVYAKADPTRRARR